MVLHSSKIRRQFCNARCCGVRTKSFTSISLFVSLQSKEHHFLYHLLLTVVVIVFPVRETENRGGRVCEKSGWKIITKLQKNNWHPLKLDFLFLSLPPFRKDCFIEYQSSIYSRQPTPVKVGKECARVLCTIWLLLCRFNFRWCRKIVIHLQFPRGKVSLEKSLPVLSLGLH